MDAAAITEAIAFHKELESDADRDLSKGLMSVLGNTEPPEWAVVLRPDPPARRSKWANSTTRKTAGLGMGRYTAGRHDVQRHQKLSRRNCRRRR